MNGTLVRTYRTRVPFVVSGPIGLGSAEEHAAAVAPRTLGDPGYTKGLYLDELPGEAADVLAERLLGRASPISRFLVFPFGGAYADPSDDDTAFGGSRWLRYLIAIEGTGPGSGVLRARPAVGPRELGPAAPLAVGSAPTSTRT
jgi:hypothetical protein